MLSLCYLIPKLLDFQDFHVAFTFLLNDQFSVMPEELGFGNATGALYCSS